MLRTFLIKLLNRKIPSNEICRSDRINTAKCQIPPRPSGGHLLALSTLRGAVS